MTKSLILMLLLVDIIISNPDFLLTLGVDQITSGLEEVRLALIQRALIQKSFLFKSVQYWLKTRAV